MEEIKLVSILTIFGLVLVAGCSSKVTVGNQSTSFNTNKVTCIFNNSNSEQYCQSLEFKELKCQGTERCTIDTVKDIDSNMGWFSSCGKLINFNNGELIFNCTNKEITCIFKNTNSTQECYYYLGDYDIAGSDKTGCTGIDECTFNYSGIEGTHLSIMAYSCFGGKHTILDGKDEQIEFDCSPDNPLNKPLTITKV